MLPEPIDARAGLGAWTGCTIGDVPVKEHRRFHAKIFHALT